MTINIYYGPLVNSHNAFLVNPLEPLTKEIKEDKFYTGDARIIECPSFLDSLKSVYVIKAFCDMKFNPNPEVPAVISPTGHPLSSDTPINGKPVNDIIQICNDHMFFIADKDCEVLMTPPYLHKTPFYGFSGILNIHRWPRHLPIATRLDEEFIIREGTPLAYIKVMTKQKYKLHLTTMPNEVISVAQQFNRQVVKGKPLKYWYEKANRTGLIKKAITSIEKHMKECK